MTILREDLAIGTDRVIETHISLVFLHETEVVKLKKPVSLGFVDYSTAELRRRACEDEVRLNRRLADRVYLGVEPVTCDSAGTHRVGGDGSPVDWVVRMNRLDDRIRADVRLAEGSLDEAWLARLAAKLARFHAQAPAGARVACHGAVESVRAIVEENFADARATIEQFVSERQAREIEQWQLEFLADNADLFAARVEAGRIREGHGDLRLEHVYFDDDGAATVIDCVEFSERLRCSDVCSDVAFLAMDLAWHDRDAWAERFLAAYATETDDFDLYPLVYFYQSYRAFVRGKVSSILAADAGADTETRERAAAEARRYYLLALASERQSIEPVRLIAVGGIIGAGKSTVAAALAHEIAAPVVTSDRTRKAIHGARPDEPLSSGAGDAWGGAYSASVSEGVYSEIARRAAAILRSGRTAVVDASFRTAAERERFARVAREHGAPFLFVEARAPLETCRDRLHTRATTGDVSDARADLLDEFAAKWEPSDALPAASRLVADTTRPLQETVREIRRRLG